MNRLFGVKLEGNERLQGTERRCLSSDAWCLGTIMTWSPSSALLLLFSLLVYYPFTVPYPRPSSAEIKESWICRQWTGTPIVHGTSLCPSSLEGSGCVKTLLFVCGQFCHKSFPCDFLESVTSRPGDDFPYRNWLRVAYYVYSGETDLSSGFSVSSLWPKS